MHAIEFQTTITDSFVHIPDYKAFENKQVRVIILDTTLDRSDQKSSFIERYTRHPVPVSDSTVFLSREEAHER